ncbi:hypothetical protein GJ688_19060 [Heliobacillus mobilis]|uniref:YmaF family protein n=1 Tax=Heliobacterium mobile TaxID=28064 RepID=A0A6I3SSK9_HELMO|nr:hypothetical protein [Heliobacterium mobile]
MDYHYSHPRHRFWFWIWCLLTTNLILKLEALIVHAFLLLIAYKLYRFLYIKFCPNIILIRFTQKIAHVLVRKRALNIHTHKYSVHTTVNKKHRHCMVGITSPEPDIQSHRHRYSGRTTLNHQHIHYYCGVTGPAVYVSGLGHYHVIEGKTSYDLRHLHFYNGRTGYSG